MGMAYLGGRFVVGVGSCWPQDFLFLAGFFSSSSFLTLASPAAGAGVANSEGEELREPIMLSDPDELYPSLRLPGVVGASKWAADMVLGGSFLFFSFFLKFFFNLLYFFSFFCSLLFPLFRLWGNVVMVMRVVEYREEEEDEEEKEQEREQKQERASRGQE